MPGRSKLDKETAMDIVAALKANPFPLAPMAAITDRPFRTLMRSLGCGPVITELVSAHGLEYKSQKTWRLMEFDESQRPIGIQLFGETPEIIARAAQVAEGTGCDFIDLNFGCPVPKVVKKGAGSAILRDLPRVREVFRTVKAAIRIPLTVKIRTGWDEATRNADEVAQIAYDEGLSWVAIHGRTRAAGYTGAADWDYIANVKARAKIPIIGNGDVATAAQAVARLRESGVDGVMIGRGCLKNPWIFREANDLWAREQAVVPMVVRSGEEPSRDFVDLFSGLRQGYESWGADDRTVQIQLKKFAAWYSAGYPGASAFRKRIFQADGVQETMSVSTEFFSELQSFAQADTSGEAFLMGGHG